MTGIRIDVTGAEDAIARLGEAAARLDNPMSLYNDIGAALVVSTQARFEREEDPQGNPWPPSIRKLVEGGRTLSDTLGLVNSITHEASQEGVAVGTNKISAAVHQFGATIKAKTAKGLRFRLPGDNDFRIVQQVTIPARPFLGLDTDDENAIEHIVSDWLSSTFDED
ncbi:MAG: phage virion morphogenesis protein [Nitratireductor sp.]|nr:phage virion morphogenesis protein [Nitratireductor sp.]